MKKDIYFDRFFGPGWPPTSALEPYFASTSGSRWFHSGGNDGASISVEGVDGTESLKLGRGRVDIRLEMWGNPNLGVLLIYEKVGGGRAEGYCSKGDLSRLREWVRSLQDTPLPIGLFVPFPEAWKAVKEFMETEGLLPTSIEPRSLSG